VKVDITADGDDGRIRTLLDVDAEALSGLEHARALAHCSGRRTPRPSARNICVRPYCLGELGEPPAPAEALEVAPEHDLHEGTGALGRQPRLPPLAACQRLAHHCALDVELELGKKEVGRERLPDGAVLVSLEDEGVRFVAPRDPVPVEHAREGALCRGARNGCPWQAVPAPAGLQTPAE
jgi:hypothetical protein